MIKVTLEKRFAVQWILSKCRENFCGFCLDKNKNNFCVYILPFKMILIKVVGKTFVVCRKSMKTVKVFSHIAFIVYGMHLCTYVHMSVQDLWSLH